MPDYYIMINNILKVERYEKIGIVIMMIYMNTIAMTLGVLSNWKRKRPISSYLPRTNILIQIVILISVFLISILFYQQDKGERAGYTPIYEYSIVLFIVGLYFSGKQRSFFSRLLILFMAYYLIRDFVGGNRVTGVQLIFIFLFMKYELKISSLVKIFILMVFSVIFLTVIAIYRTSFDAGSFNLLAVWNILLMGGFTNDTAVVAYHTSITFIAISDLYSVTSRLGSLWDFIRSQFSIGSAGPSLTEIAGRTYTHYNGGIFPYHFYYYLGWAGVVVAGVITSLYLRLIASNPTQGASRIVAVYISATVPRWYLYNPTAFFKGAIITLLVYHGFLLLEDATQLLKNKRRKIENPG
jgi:hypothetical protein